jgi:hypothetical protein
MPTVRVHAIIIALNEEPFISKTLYALQFQCLGAILSQV